MFKNIALGSVAAVVVLHVITLVDLMDVFKKPSNFGAKDCYHVSGVKYGAEDIQIIKEKNVAIISSGFRPHFPSNLFLLNLDHLSSSAKVEPLEFDEDFDKSTFHPHGIYVWKTNTGEYHVYVVNHHDDFECVDVFNIDFENKKAGHIKRITDPLFKNMNDLVVIDDFSFYVTNWLPGRNKLENLLKGLLMLPVGDVVFFDGKVGDIAVKSLFIPNGIDIAPDKETVFVGLSGSKAIATYSRGSDNTLHFIQQYPAGGVVDNLIYVPAEGDKSAELWFAGPFRMLESTLRVFNIDKHSKVSSFVSKFNVDADGVLSDLSEIYINDGTFISGSSCATPFKDFLMIGSVDDRMIICKP